MIATVFDNIPLAREDDRDAARAHGRRRARGRGPARPRLDPAAARRRHRDHGRAAPRDQRGVGHPHAPAAAAAQAARPRARARRHGRARAVGLADGDATAGGRTRRARRATRSARAARRRRRRAAVVFTGLVVLFLYRVLPDPRPKTREIWPGAVVAALLLGVVREALELYFEELSDFGALYGSLGALMALLVFVFAAANVLVFGAEFASEWSRLPPPERDARDRRARPRAAIRPVSRAGGRGSHGMASPAPRRVLGSLALARGCGERRRPRPGRADARAGRARGRAARRAGPRRVRGARASASASASRRCSATSRAPCPRGAAHEPDRALARPQRADDDRCVPHRRAAATSTATGRGRSRQSGLPEPQIRYHWVAARRAAC